MAVNVLLGHQWRRVLPLFWKIGQEMSTGLGVSRLGSRLLNSVNNHVDILREDM